MRLLSFSAVAAVCALCAPVWATEITTEQVYDLSTEKYGGQLFLGGSAWTNTVPLTIKNGTIHAPDGWQDGVSILYNSSSLTLQDVKIAGKGRVRGGQNAQFMYTGNVVFEESSVQLTGNIGQSLTIKDGTVTAQELSVNGGTGNMLILNNARLVAESLYVPDSTIHVGQADLFKGIIALVPGENNDPEEAMVHITSWNRRGFENAKLNVTVAPGEYGRRKLFTIEEADGLFFSQANGMMQAYREGVLLGENEAKFTFEDGSIYLEVFPDTSYDFVVTALDNAFVTSVTIDGSKKDLASSYFVSRDYAYEIEFQADEGYEFVNDGQYDFETGDTVVVLKGMTSKEGLFSPQTQLHQEESMEERIAQAKAGEVIEGLSGEISADGKTCAGYSCKEGYIFVKKGDGIALMIDPAVQVIGSVRFEDGKMIISLKNKRMEAFKYSIVTAGDLSFDDFDSESWPEGKDEAEVVMDAPQKFVRVFVSER